MQDDDKKYITIVTTDKYAEKHASHIEEWQKHIKTSHGTFLADVVSCLDVLRGEDGTPELVIRIKANHGSPYQITKQWVVKKESYNKR